MNQLLAIALLAVLVGAGVTPASAEGAASDEQKAAAREKARAQWESLTPEQKAAAREKAKAKWESLTPEEKAAAKKAFAQRHPAAAQQMAERERAASATVGK